MTIAQTIINESQALSNGNFGKVFSRNVDDQIYAQPLVMSNVSIASGTHNIVIVATVNNTLYAFDADDPNASSPYWQKNLTYDPANYRPIKNTDMPGACFGNYTDFSGNMGIVGTPAIDTVSNTLYVVSRSVKKSGTQVFVQYLHAIDISTGAEKFGGPTYITASVPGTGPGNVGGMVTFDQQKQNQRPGLLLYDGVVYISWASHCDWGPFHGWVIGYDATTLARKYVYNTTPDGGLGGIWMSGQPPSVDDDGNLYVTTGNGSTGKNGDPNNVINRGSSLIKLSKASGALNVADFFTPATYNYLNDHDLDYGVDGVLLIPGTNMSLSGSKEGRLFLIDNNNMGHTTGDNSNVLQTLNVANTNTSNTRHLHGSPVYYKDENSNEYVYAWSEGSLLKQFPFDRSSMRFDTINVKTGNTVLPNGMPGAMLSLSSNGSQHGTGIIWANHPIHGDANQMVVPGVLQAFDATDVTRELWNSNWNSKRDSIGSFAKFVPPTIANGKVYMATFSNKLNVYGLNPPPASSCTNTLPPQWQSADIGYVFFAGDVCVDNNGVFTVTASGDDIYNTADAFHFAFQQVITNETEITARVTSIENTDPIAKCGVMFRQNLDPGSPYVFLFLTPSNIGMQQRSTQSGVANNAAPQKAQSIPYWVRIYNKGNKYVSYYSANGDDWTPMDSVTFSLGTNPYVGIAYTSHDNYILGTALVDNVSISVGGVLSVNLINFNGKNLNDKSALLNWTTASEINNDHFEIQRSTSNTDFEMIGSVRGKGSSSKSQIYTFNDNRPQDGINYYRLKQVDKDGNVTFSSTIPVRFNLKKIEIYPNPAHSRIYIKDNINFSYRRNLKIQLLDFSGKVYYNQISKSNGDIITINIPPNILNGMYLIMVSNSKGEKQGDKIWINR